MVNSLRRIEIDENFIIPPDSLGIAKHLDQITLKKFHKFTNYGCRIVITLRTSNMRFLIPLKDKSDR